MKPLMNPEERRRIDRLKHIMSCNDRFAWLLFDFLNDNPAAISQSMIRTIDPDGDLGDSAAFLLLLTAICGIDTEGCEADRQMVNDYFRLSVRQLEPQKYYNDPFLLNIRIPCAAFAGWKLEQLSYRPFEAFVFAEPLMLPDYREIPQIGYFNQEFRFPAVLENGREWMAIKPGEIETMQAALGSVSGKVVTFGLGLGYFTYMASLKKDVESVTVVEKSRDVILLFEKLILPQFEHRDKIHIVAADAFAYAATEMARQNFDCAFVDLWHDASDGLEMYLQMKKLQHHCPSTRFFYWIEDTLLALLRRQIFASVLENARSVAELEACLGKAFLEEYAVRF
jgi:hypothetical protein